MSPMQAVIGRIEELRADTGMSIFVFAKACDLPQTTVKELISGKNGNVGINTLTKIANGLGVSLRDFFDSDLFFNIDRKYL